MNVSKFKVAFFENFSQTFNCARGTRVSGSIPERGSGGESHTHRAQYAAGSACGKKIPEYRLRYGRHTFCRDHRTYQGSQYFSPGQRLKAGHLCGQMCRKWYPITAARGPHLYARKAWAGLPVFGRLYPWPGAEIRHTYHERHSPGRRP